MKFYEHVAILTVLLVFVGFSSSILLRKAELQETDKDGIISEGAGGNSSLSGGTNGEVNLTRGNETQQEPVAKRPKKSWKEKMKNPIFGILFSKVQKESESLPETSSGSMDLEDNNTIENNKSYTMKHLTSGVDMKTEKEKESNSSAISVRSTDQIGLEASFQPTSNGMAKHLAVQGNVDPSNTVASTKTMTNSNCLSHYMFCDPKSEARNGGCCFGMICAKTTFANICLYFGWDSDYKGGQPDNLELEQRVQPMNMEKVKNMTLEVSKQLQNMTDVKLQ